MNRNHFRHPKMTALLNAAFLFSLFPLLNCISIELFTGENFVGYIPFGTNFNGWMEDPPSCFNFPQVARKKLSSFISNEHCVLFYDQENCRGNSIKLEKDVTNIAHLAKNGTQDNFDDKAVSLRACSEAEGGSKVNVDFFKDINYGGLIRSYKDVCRCTNIPMDQLNFSSIDNHHSCILLFTTTDCQDNEGIQMPLYAGKGIVSGAIGTIEFPLRIQIRSFRPCEAPPHCMKFSAEIFRYEVAERPSNNTKYSSVSMGAHSTFFNNGSAVVLQQYSPKMSISEEMSIERIEFNKRISSWTVASRWSLEFELDVPFANLKKSLPLDLGDTYGNSCEKGQLSTEAKHTAYSSSDYTITQTIKIPPCSAYEVNATLYVVEDFEMDYRVYFRLQGEYNGQGHMTAENLRDEIKTMEGYNYAYEEDSRTIVAWTHSQMSASFGIETSINGRGYKIRYCYN